MNTYNVLWYEFPALLPAVYHSVFPTSGVSDHMTMKHDETEGISHSMVGPRGVVEHRHVTICSCLQKYILSTCVQK